MLMGIQDAIPELRREKLRKWIDEHCEGSQAKFVEMTGINQGELSGLLKNKSFGEKKARNLEQQANMPAFYLDTYVIEGEPLAASDTENDSGSSIPEFLKETKLKAGYTGTPRAPSGSHIVVGEDSDYVAIKRVDFKISAGISGYAVEYLNGERAPIFFRKDWVEKRGYKPEKLHAVPVSGESMEYSLFDGDLVVINTDETKPVDGEVFAANYEGELVIKRMVREAGQWYLSSDNPDKRRFPNKLCHDQCYVIGRIIYKQSERI